MTNFKEPFLMTKIRGEDRSVKSLLGQKVIDRTRRLDGTPIGVIEHGEREFPSGPIHGVVPLFLGNEKCISSGRWSEYRLHNACT